MAKEQVTTGKEKQVRIKKPKSVTDVKKISNLAKDLNELESFILKKHLKKFEKNPNSDLSEVYDSIFEKVKQHLA